MLQTTNEKGKDYMQQVDNKQIPTDKQRTNNTHKAILSGAGTAMGALAGGRASIFKRFFFKFLQQHAFQNSDTTHFGSADVDNSGAIFKLLV